MISQRYELYTPVEQHTWMLLFERQLEAVEQFAYLNFLTGIQQLNFTASAIPDFDEVNLRLRSLTGWSIFAVPGLIDNDYFFEKIFEQQFAATTWIRKPENIDYLEEPDMFHDVFGHVPMLTDHHICDYLLGLSAIARKYITNEEVIEAIARLYWYTIEFGLVKENNQLKIYGAGILSSIGETSYALSDTPARVPFDVMQIIDTPYIKDSFQKQYFVLDDMQQLKECLPQLAIYFEKTYGNQVS
jgi:phenylalanine-4-hydroxylase